MGFVFYVWSIKRTARIHLFSHFPFLKKKIHMYQVYCSCVMCHTELITILAKNKTLLFASAVVGEQYYCQGI